MATLEDLQLKGYDLTKKEISLLNKKMIGIYKTGLDEMRNTVTLSMNVLDNVDPEYYFFEMNKFNRLKKLEKAYKKISNTMWNKIGNVIIETGNLAFTNNYYYQQFALSWYIDQYKFYPVNENAITAAVLGENVRKIDVPLVPKYGNIVNTLTKNKQATINRLDDVLIQGIKNGKSSAVIGKGIKDVLGISAGNAQRISRTEVNRILNSAAYSNNMYLLNQGNNVKRMYIATLDTKTRQQSGNMDGQIATVDGFRYPNGSYYQIIGNTGIAKYDINDRCTEMTIIDDIAPTERSGKNPITGKSELVSYQVFDDWMTNNGLKRGKSGKII